MTQQLKRIDPYWHTHPMIPTAVAIGAILALIGFLRVLPALAIGGGVIAGLAILVATRPAISAILATMGLFGGILSFFIVPNLSTAGMSAWLKLVSTAMFMVFYAVLMDALVLVLSVLYNFYSQTLGLNALRLEFEAAEDTAAE